MKIFEDVNMQGRHIHNCPDFFNFDDNAVSTQYGWSSAKIQAMLDKIVELLPGSERIIVSKVLSDTEGDDILDSSGDSIAGRLIYQKI